MTRSMIAGGWWLVAGGWWLVGGGWWVVGDWERVAYELTYERRFFNERASKLFEALLHEALTAKNPECLEAPAVIKILPTGTELYRARRRSMSGVFLSRHSDHQRSLGATSIRKNGSQLCFFSRLLCALTHFSPGWSRRY
jgi:hypothetical protein